MPYFFWFLEILCHLCTGAACHSGDGKSFGLAAMQGKRLPCNFQSGSRPQTRGLSEAEETQMNLAPTCTNCVPDWTAWHRITRITNLSQLQDFLKSLLHEVLKAWRAKADGHCVYVTPYDVSWCIMTYHQVAWCRSHMNKQTLGQVSFQRKKVPCQIYTIIYNTVTHQKRAWVKEATVHHFWQSIYYASTFTLASLGWGARCSIIFDMLMLMFVLRKGLKLKETFLLAPLVSFRGKNRSFCGSENARWWMMLLGVSRESCFHPNCTLF